MKIMKVIYVLTIILLIFQTSCSHRPPEQSKEQKEIQALRWRLLDAYREIFEELEYPKLNDFEKKGYDWYFSTTHRMESSGFITEAEASKILKEHGPAALKSWSKGYEIAGKIWSKALNEKISMPPGYFPGVSKRRLRKELNKQP